jgi:hypothetical protein
MPNFLSYRRYSGKGPFGISEANVKNKFFFILKITIANTSVIITPTHTDLILNVTYVVTNLFYVGESLLTSFGVAKKM